jgi:hypothetical protein
MTFSKKLSFQEKFLRWRKNEGLKGPEAMSRYAFFCFVEAISFVSSDFVLKGGNLLWIYTKTPRETVDIDFSTLNLNSHKEVREVIDKACSQIKDISFVIEDFKEMDHENMFGSRFKIKYESTSGASNKFQVDIVYKLSTDLKKIKTPLTGQDFMGASLENIISDKLSAILSKIEFTTRIKDFDDLWRLSQSGIDVNKNKLIELFNLVGISNPIIDYGKISRITEKGWNKQCKRYKDLPSSLEVAVIDINRWIKSLKVE